MDGGYTSAIKRRRAQQSARATPRILVVEDDDRVRRVLRESLEAGGYAVVEARCEAEARAALKAQSIALITLDLSLKHEDGLAIARAIRVFSDVPIVMVTARSDEIDRIVGLEIGADDYIVKPFNVREVVARVRAVLRRTDERAQRPAQTGDEERICFAGWSLDCHARTLASPQACDVPLTTAEFRMLHALATHPGRVLSREALLDLVVGPDADPLERSIDTIVSRLRRKIETDAAKPQFVKTVRGVGYVFAVKTTY